MYHRFVLKKNKAQPENEGILSFGTTLWTEGSLEEKLDEEIGKIIKWFNHHIPAPESFSHGVFWFKEQKKIINKMQELACFIFKHTGEESAYIIAEELGKIFYEDKVQVVASSKRRKWKVQEN